MEKEIRDYVGKCDVCKASKASKQNQISPLGKQREGDRPWQMIYIDLIGPLPRPKNGFRHVVVAVDAFSKFVRAKPLREATAKGVVDFVKSDLFLTFGIPEIVISDNAKQFISAEFKALLKQCQVKIWHTSKYHPQANAVEATNKTLETSIRTYLTDDSDHTSWDKFLFKIVCAMNTSAHTATKLSPYLVNFGQEMMTSGARYVDKHVKDKNEFPDMPRLRKIRQIVKENLKRQRKFTRNWHRIS